MRGELVALDLETTGLNHLEDSIIEIGAVRMIDGQIVDEFSTFVDPGIAIPPPITHLTGIRSADVEGAPRIDAALPRLVAFVGDAPVIAHNISLDMAFLQQRHGVLLRARKLDTYELASILVPRAPRYSLNSLTSEMGISLEHAHRALDDARATALLYWKLWQRMSTLPRAVLQELVDLGRGLEWEAGQVFRAALVEAENLPVGIPPAFSRAPEVREASQLDGQRAAVDSVTPVLGSGGLLEVSMPDYEHRPQQLTMAQAIETAFDDGHHLMVEAGTGTGKSIAYLTPAVLWAVNNNRQVVISTNTINLQDQLIGKDIPMLREALGNDFRAAVLKGRSNYLCPRRLETVRRRRPTSLGELRTLAKVLVWLLETPTADRGEISLRGPVENGVWQRLSAEDEGCSLDRCQGTMGGACPFYKHIVIANHALLIADAATGGMVLPDYSHLIVDEAHHLEDAITSGLEFEIDQNALVRRIADLGGPNRGLLGDILERSRGKASEKDIVRLESFIQVIDEATSLMRGQVEGFFAAVQHFVKEVHNPRMPEYISLVRIAQPQRSRDSFGAVQHAWDNLAEYFEVIGEAMTRLTQALRKFAPYGIEGQEDFVFSTETAGQFLSTVHTQLNAFVYEPDPNAVYWVALGQASGDLPTIHAAPLDVGPLMDRYIWSAKESVVLTSATLRTGDSFSYVGERLHLEDVELLDVGSPFDYESSTLLYLPTDIPEPNDRVGYQRALERGIIELAAALNGRVMVLFTSYTQLRQTAQAITPRLALGGITVYDQSDGSSRQALLDGFMTNEKAVLMGTRSFWEGVDIPGDSLSALVITRLPFAVPTDPVFSARGETYQNSFEEFAVPDAVLRFRQGFGRLIRRATDRGVVTVFDSRILTKGYGMVFLESLPTCTLKQGPLDGLAPAAKQWLERGY
jgi:DNA polymerase-3 subunit epsilon/ATP-dependent DNA helicase DinG